MLIALAVVVLVLVGAPVAAAADAPAGPRLAAVALLEPSGFKDPRSEPDVSMALATFDPSTGKETRLRQGRFGPGAPVPFHGPVWSPDGGQIFYGGYGKGLNGKGGVYVVAADGTGLRQVAGTLNGSNPVLSPDGRTLAFARNRFEIHIDKKHRFEPWKDRSWIYSSTSTWIIDLAGGKPRRLTPWENGLDNTPTSFSPDGANLLLTRDDNNRDSPRVMRMSLADGKVRKLLGGAKEAVYSPDGSRIAFTGVLHPDVVETEEGNYLAEELYLANADGTQVRRLSRSDDVLESTPSWDPSGQRLAYVQFRAPTTWLAGLAALFPTGNSLMQVNADGSCRQKIASKPSLAFYGIAWQPGPGREAGPIIC
jgi:Tol biopolymer transport system component